MKFFYHLVEVDFFKKFLDTASTHFNGDEVFVAFIHVFEVAIIYFVNNCAFYEASKDSFLVAIAFFEFFEFLSLIFGEFLNCVTIFILSFCFVTSLDSLTSNIGLCFEIFEALVDFFLLGINNDIRSKVNDFLDVLDGNVKQEAKCGWSTTHEPDMCYWCSEADVTHALTTSNTLSYEVAFLIDSSFARAYALELWIVWINIFDWTKDAFTEETITFWLLSTVVDSFWF